MHCKSPVLRTSAIAIPPGNARRPRFSCVVLHWIVLGLLLTSLPGCSGCRPQASNTKDGEKKKEEKPKEDIESREIQILPTDENLAHYGAKPGHWIGLRHNLRANRADFKGEIVVFPTERNGGALPLANSPYRPLFIRPAVLPKGQYKSIELTCFVPVRAESGKQIYLQSELRTEYGGAVRHLKSQVTNSLRPHQAFLVVLARRPDTYAYLKTLQSVRPTIHSGGMGDVIPDYITILPKTDRNIPLPSWSSMWTSIGCTLWDDVDPKVLSRDQQQAMLEWLHWGGQLIVSGPTSLDTLQTSFLAPYLPTKAGKMRPMTQTEATRLDEVWSISNAQSKRNPRFPWNAESPLEVMDWELQPGGQIIEEAGSLVAERRVGRGRIVVTAFSLSSRPWVTWNSIDNFFNGCLLRRPGRVYSYSDDSGAIVRWKSDELMAMIGAEKDAETLERLSQAGAFEMDFSNANRTPQEALLNSRLRYFSRDASAMTRPQSSAEVRPWDLLGYQTHAQSGVAGWNENGECSRRAQAALTTGAGISIPDAGFVLSCLGVYLFVLVPANWTIFRALGRVEWAWIAVPFLAIIGTLTVVRLARLDIGFARSRTEVVVVETQPDFPHAHVSRFTGLYSALTTQYDLIFDHDSALALPISSSETMNSNRMTMLDAVFRRRDRRGEKVALESFLVSSNSTSMIHSEQMLDLEGKLSYTKRSESTGDLSNTTSLELQDVGVLRRSLAGNLEFAWVGKLSPKATMPIYFEKVADENAPTKSWKTFQSSPDGTNKKPVSLRSLLELATHTQRLQPGASCLIGRFENHLKGLVVSPDTNQFETHGLLVAHLAHAPLPPPDADLNAAPDPRTESPDD